MSTLLSVSIAMLAGLLMTRIGKKLSLPAVTAYLVAGVLIGPYCLGALHIDGVGFTSSEAVSRLSLVSEVALGFIAFSIGNEFRLKDLKATGRQAAVIGVVQALGATILVDLSLLALHLIMPDKITTAQAITLGAIATATAPAATATSYSDTTTLQRSAVHTMEVLKDYSYAFLSQAEMDQLNRN